MPGIVGIIDPENRVNTKSLLTGMLKVMKHEDFYMTDQYFDPPIALGRIHLGLNSEPQPIFNEDQSLSIVMEGEIYNHERLQRRILQNHRLELNSDPELVLHLFEECGEDFVNFLNGSFTLAIWNSKQKEIILANDRYGLRPLYFAPCDAKFVFASEVKGVIEDRTVPRIIDEQAIADFFTFGYLLGDKTFLKSVKVLPSASVCVIDTRDARFTIKRYWDFDFSEGDSIELLDNNVVSEFNFLFKRAVNRQTCKNNRLGVGLSGGLDARMILAAMKPETLDRVYTYTFGAEGCLDQRLAEIVALTLGVDHDFYELYPSYLRESAKKYIEMTDGMIPFHHSHGVDKIFGELKKHMDIVFICTGAEILSGVYISDVGIAPEFMEPSNGKTLSKIIFTKTNSIIPYNEQKEFFSKTYEKNCRLSFNNLRRELAKAKALLPANKADYFHFQNRWRRFCYLGFRYANRFFEYRSPYFDNDLIDFHLRLSPYLRANGYVRNQLLQICYPKVARIPSTSIREGQKIENICKRMTQIIQKISRGKITRMNLKDHHVDHNYWFRTELRDFIESIVLDPQTLSRPYFNPRYIEHLVKQHMTGKRNLADQLSAIATFELWHRMFIDAS